MYSGKKISTYFVISLLVIALLPNLLSNHASALTIDPTWIANGWKQTIPNNAGPTTLITNIPPFGNIDLLSNETLPAPSDPIGVVFVTSPTLGTVSYDPVSTLVTYTPNPTSSGLDVFTYQDCNTTTCSNVATIYITVTPGANTPPTALPFSISVNQGSTIHIPIGANGSDTDGDTWWITSWTAGNHGNVVLDPADTTNKTLIYTANAAIPPYSGPDSFTYQLSDGHQHGNIATVGVTIKSVNVPPTASSQSVTALENGPVSIVLGATNYDPTQTLSYIIVTNPTHGTLTGTLQNRVYTPALNYYGSDSFTFKVNDGIVDSNTATIYISVQHVFQSPVVVPDRYQVIQHSSTVMNVLANDSSVDISQGFPVTLSVNSVTNPLHGSVVINPDRTITYTPNPTYFGPDSFTYTASIVNSNNIALATSSPATVSINVSRALSTPVITTLSQYTNNIHQTITGTGDTSVTVKVYDGATLIGTTTSDSSGNWSVPVILIANTSNILTAQETDTANNLVSPVSQPITITVITTSPSITSLHIQSSNTNHTLAKVGDTVTLTFTSSTTIQTPVVTIAGHTVTATSSGNNWSAQYVMTATDLDGAIPFTINYQDLANNVGTPVTGPSVGNSILFDKTSPTISITTPANNAVITATNIQVSGTASDTGSGLQKVEVQVDNQGSFVLATDTSSWTITIHPSPNPHTITARATDNAGNVQTSSITIYVNAPIPPTLSQVHIQSSNTNPVLAKVGDTVTLAFTSSTPIQTPVVTIAGHTVTVAAANVAGTSWAAQYVMTATDLDGAIPFTINYQDLTGTLGTQVTTTTDASSVLFDKTSPTISIINPANNAIIKIGSIPITGTASDSGSGLQKVEVQLDSGAFVLATGTSSWTLTVNPSLGPHTITARATDNAGNVQTSSISITIVNNTPGKVTGGGGVGDSKFAFEVKSKDGLSFQGNLEFQDNSPSIKLKSTSITSLFVDASGTTATFGGNAIVNKHSGYTFQVYIEDHGEPGRNDVFAIKIFDSHGTLVDSVSGTLSHGNIVIHQSGDSSGDDDGHDWKECQKLRDSTDYSDGYDWNHGNHK